MTAIVIRPALPADAPACIDLRGRTRQNAVPAERLAALGITAQSWSAQIASGRLPGHVALLAGEMVGYCFGDADSGEIVVLALLPDYEARGLGRTLLQKVIDELRAAHGHGRLFLGCSSDPASRSHDFYRHLGWRPTGEIDKYGDELLELLPPN
ncbi:GNAT family N-acetyltransferase [Roseateles violae]|uniref:GNAT family N-acetyltransferase n=1 Tax=Roseateles violae TaxID=3058042 RepID=A0ABT8DZZ4_9BURK|nr:GNAT family N-acetyltransferase [Pelomonas sp. PFR6]MDN3923128.1 GNAT family N-acetyltransferase [Pelomonas sp. PFR6]